MGLFSGIRRAWGTSLRRVANYILPDDMRASFFTYIGPDGQQTTIEAKGACATAYFSNAWRACALAKARPLAALPVHVYQRDKYGVRREATGYTANALSRILRDRWNPFMTAMEGFRWLDMTKDIRGNAFARVEWRGARPYAIWPLAGEPDIQIARGNVPVFEYGGDKFTPAGRYLSHEILWVKSPIIDSDTLKGKSLAELAAQELGMSIELEKFYSSLLGGEGNFPGWLETDQPLDEQEYNRIKKMLEDGKGLVNAGAIRIFDNGLKYHSTNQSMADISLIDQERWILQQLCRTLCVPQQEVSDLSNATYSNIEQGALNFANKTLVPECAEIERAFTSVLEYANLTDCYVQFDMNGLLRGSYKERMEGYRIGVLTGFLCPNDVRAKEDMAPYEGGDMFLRPASYIPVDPETGEEMEGARGSSAPDIGQAGEGAPPYTSTDPTETRDALRAIHDDMEKRVSDRFRERGDTPQTRDFAVRVLAPYANACTMARVEYDIQADIERISENA